MSGIDTAAIRSRADLHHALKELPLWARDQIDVLCDEVDRLRAQVGVDAMGTTLGERMLGLVRSYRLELEQAEDDRDEARAALDRVRALHASSLETRGVVRWERDLAKSVAYCEECGDTYPCPTFRALDGAS